MFYGGPQYQHRELKHFIKKDNNIVFRLNRLLGFTSLGTSAGGLSVPEGIISSVVSPSVLT